MKSIKLNSNAVLISAAILFSSGAVVAGFYKLTEEIKLSSECPNPWFQMGKGWQCHGERYPGVMEREKQRADWAATLEGRNAIMFKRSCQVEHSEVNVTRTAVAIEIAALELCREKLARYPKGVVN